MKFRISLAGRRKAIVLATTSALVAAGLVGVATNTAYAQSGCTVNYVKQWDSVPGFGANVTITNHGPALNGWTLTFTFPGNQQITNGWIARWSQSGQNVTAQNETWNANLPTGASVTPGFNGSYSGTNTNPNQFRLNGTLCTGPSQSSPPPSSPTQSSPPPSSPTQSSPPPSSPTQSSPPPGQRVDNPYANAAVYVNPDWRANAQAGGAPSSISNQPTAVWLDRRAAITGGSEGNSTGLVQHLNNAVQQDQANGSTPTVIQIVIYNLPGRDCSALASNGELGPNDLPIYQSQYIDVIAEILGRAAYANLRKVTIIEIDSLPNLVTNVSGRPGAVALCDTMLQNGGYVNGVGYALDRLANVGAYNYIDAAHHGWIGWDTNDDETARMVCSAANANGATPADVHGLITNTANYSALEEPYVGDIFRSFGTSGQPVRSSTWIDWNQFNAELPFAQAFRTIYINNCPGTSQSLGMLIDTSRNGWGGAARPSGPSSSTDLNTFVNQSRIDRRIHKGNWCNQSGAGLGERPRANPASGIDAYVWVKPPGESDGSSSLIPVGPENPDGKGFDQMCDPDYGGNVRNGNNLSGALDNSPVSGRWFQAQFEQLLANAFPPVS
jgi:cellulose 1,4-beta-cellobiosidase